MKDSIEQEKEKARNAENSMSSLRAKCVSNEQELSGKVDQLASMAHASDSALEEKRRLLEESEKSVHTWRTECLELKSKLSALRTTHDDLVTRLQQKDEE